MRTDGPLKVLVVEDESIVALVIETMLEELGCVVVASVPRPRKALDLASFLDFDLAVLDINLAGEVVYPLAFRLNERGTPFMFTTGYRTEKGLPLPTGDGVREPQNRRVENRHPLESRFDWQQPLSVLPLWRGASDACFTKLIDLASALFHTNDRQYSFQA